MLIVTVVTTATPRRTPEKGVNSKSDFSEKCERLFSGIALSQMKKYPEGQAPFELLGESELRFLQSPSRSRFLSE
jgi:hypothetical protein